MGDCDVAYVLAMSRAYFCHKGGPGRPGGDLLKRRGRNLAHKGTVPPNAWTAARAKFYAMVFNACAKVHESMHRAHTPSFTAELLVPNKVVVCRSLPTSDWAADVAKVKEAIFQWASSPRSSLRTTCLRCAWLRPRAQGGSGVSVHLIAAMAFECAYGTSSSWPTLRQHRKRILQRTSRLCACEG